MKILLRRMFDGPSSHRWRTFEQLMIECLEELGHQVVVLDLVDPEFPPDPVGMDFKIYAHKNRNEVPHGTDLCYKEMHLKGLFTVDPLGWGAAHSACAAPPPLAAVDGTKARAFCEAMRSNFLREGHSKHEQPQLKPIADHYKPYLFVPLQLPTDDTIKNHSPVSLLEFVDLLGHWARGCGQHLVFKLHPCVYHQNLHDAVMRHVAACPHIFCLNKNVHALIDGAAAVCVINSGVGFESLIHGKPVISFGRSDYQWLTCRATGDNLDDALKYVASFGEAERLRGYRFIYHYVHHHAFSTQPSERIRTRRRLTAYLAERLALPDPTCFSHKLCAKAATSANQVSRGKSDTSDAIASRS